jgi:hypothetical protein
VTKIEGNATTGTQRHRGGERVYIQLSGKSGFSILLIMDD